MLSILACLSVIAYKLTFASLGQGRTEALQHVDYTNIVVILLTTVTVVFTLFAVALAGLSIWGFNNIKITTSEIAKETAEKEFKTAFNEGGQADNIIRDEFTKDAGPLQTWVKKQIKVQVSEQLALYNPSDKIDEDDPTDEGNIS